MRTYPVYDGIPSFGSLATGEDSYDRVDFEFVFEMQQQHFWHVSRREILYTLLQQSYHNELSNIVMIEIGCGCGGVLQFLHSKGINVEGGDTFLEGLQLCAKHTNVPLYQLDAQRTPFADDQYDVVGLFDVIEHIDDDQAALREMYRICKPGGRIILTVPAHKWFWSYSDRIRCHKRRYSKKELYYKLRQASFVVERLSFFMLSLFLPLSLYRRLRNIRAQTAHTLSSLTETQTIPLINEVLLSILRQEKWLIKHTALPMGTSLVAVARKK
jgi:SAM-dependent methyltransferase